MHKLFSKGKKELDEENSDIVEEIVTYEKRVLLVLIEALISFVVKVLAIELK